MLAAADWGCRTGQASHWLKRQVKEAVKAIDRFLNCFGRRGRRRGLSDGGVRPHPSRRYARSTALYMNDGDWVESCTALVEHHDGRMELIDWASLNRLSVFAPRLPKVAQTV